MMGDPQVDRGALFYEFCLERHVPQDHLLRVRAQLAGFYSPIDRPSTCRDAVSRTSSAS